MYQLIKKKALKNRAPLIPYYYFFLIKIFKEGIDLIQPMVFQAEVKWAVIEDEEMPSVVCDAQSMRN